MTAETRVIEQGIEIVVGTIRETDLATADRNAEGYYTSDGTHRGLAYGREPNGQIWLWITTSGCDIAISDEMDHESWLAACDTMGDKPDPIAERIKIGYGRIAEAANEIGRATGTPYSLPPAPADDEIADYVAAQPSFSDHNEVE